MKLTGKIISFVLCIAIIISSFAIMGTAAETNNLSSMEKLPEKYPVVFVPGVGQSQTYLYDGYGNEISSWNLINVNTNFKTEDYFKIAKVAIPLVFSAFIGKNLIEKESLSDLMQVLFKNIIIDDNGDLRPGVNTPCYKYPVSKYQGEAKRIFYNRIPCQELIDYVGADNVYCYNYSCFSYTYKVAAGLNDFIKNVVLKQTGADKVILVPMSMGATVVNAYFDDYAEEKDVAKVISIVGAWNGSDVFADLVTNDFDEDAPEMVYNGLVAELVGEPYGYLVNLAVRIFPKAVLSDIIREVLSSLCEEVMFKTTSFLSLIPSERFKAISEKYLSGNGKEYIKLQAEKYYKYQSNLKANFKKLTDDYGIDFYFICGYNMGFGSNSSDFRFFEFFNSADETNSDEIIQISSTAPGTSFVKAGTKFLSSYKAVNPVCTDKTHNHISPDGSIDASTAYFPEKTWYFEGQTHELTYNNTALSLAFRIVRGEIKDIHDCEDTFPQFNESRDVKKLVNDYIPQAEALDRKTLSPTLSIRLDNALKEAKEMVNRTINDRDKDDAIIEELYNCLVEAGVYSVSAPTKSEIVMTKIFKALSDGAYKIFGAKGFSDLGKK